MPTLDPYRRARVLIALAGLASVTSTASSVRADVVQPVGGTLSLRVGEVRTAALPDLLQADAALTQLSYVIVLRDPMTAAARAALVNAGVQVLDYLPTNAFLADLRATTPARLRASGLVASVHAWQDAWKVAPELLAAFAPPPAPPGAPAPPAGRPVFATDERKALASRGEIGATITLFPGASAANFAQSLQAIPGTHLIDSELVANNLVMQVTLPATSVGLLASLPEVLFAEPMPEFTLRSTRDSRWVVTTNQPDNFAVYTAGLTGVGQICGIIDSAMDTNHCAFLDNQPIGPTHRKIQAYNAPLNASLHGSHTSSILLANAIGGDAGPIDPPPTTDPNPDLQGVAYGARAVYNGYPSFGESSVYGRFELHRTQGAFVHSNSWGNDATRAYDSTCRALDNFMWTNEDQFLAFSASNSSLITNPENAKNVLAVGASRNAPVQNEFCQGGAGPTLDGRRKPDVLAPGCSINAAGASTGCSTVSLTGTSMACPAAAGVATLMRQYFTQGWYPTGAPNSSNAFVPSGALLKAMVVNSATDLTAVAQFPGPREGWGRVLADNALYLANRTPAETRRVVVWDARSTSDRSINTGQSRTYRINVLDAGEPLKITLAYTDAPALTGASNPVVNNLNLVVTAPDTSSYVGNYLVGGASVTGGSADAINNLEQVLIPAPSLGIWTITVSGAAVNVGPQGFAVVATGNLFEVTCNDIDFNNDGVYFDVTDVDAFFSVYVEGPCIPDTSTCDSIDFNNDSLFFDPADIDAFLRVYSEGPCE